MIKKNGIIKLPFIFGVLFFVVGYILYPLYKLCLAGFSQQNALQQLLQKTLLTAGFNSLLLSVITVMGSAIIGVYFAYIFHYTKTRFTTFFSTMVLLPIAIPPTPNA